MTSCTHEVHLHWVHSWLLHLVWHLILHLLVLHLLLVRKQLLVSHMLLVRHGSELVLHRVLHLIRHHALLVINLLLKEHVAHHLVHLHLLHLIHFWVCIVHLGEVHLRNRRHEASHLLLGEGALEPSAHLAVEGGVAGALLRVSFLHSFFVEAVNETHVSPTLRVMVG